MNLTLLLLSIASLMVSFFLCLFAYQTKKIEEVPFNFRQYFLYEAFSAKNEKILRAIQTILVLCNVASCIILFFVPHDETVTSKYYFLMIAAFEILVELFFTLLTVLSFKKEKLRVASFMFYGASIATRNGTSGLILLSISRKAIDNNSTIALIFAIFSFIFAGLAFIPLMNPKLSNYAKMDQVIEKDGSSHYERPKYFVMAFSEWLLFFLSEISLVDTLIFFYILN